MSSAPLHHTRPRRDSFSRPSASLLALIRSRLRLMGERRAAESLRTSVPTLLALRDGGTVSAGAIARLESATSQHLKTCPCGKEYSLASWLALPYIGVQRDEEDSRLDCELRDCACTSTIAVLVSDVRRQVAA